MNEPVRLPLELLRCPLKGEALQRSGDELVSSSGHRYRITPSGIPLFAERHCSLEARSQQEHYDHIASAYIANLTYPHTQEYMSYLDQVLLDAIRDMPLDTLAEICCGQGEAVHLLNKRFRRAVAVDVSLSMLEAGVRKHESRTLSFVQGDATMLPLASDAFDAVAMLGGIHHVNDREKLFAEVARILKPGGFFFWREPVSDFFLWRWLRAIVYRVSPLLDANTERPLLYRETAPILAHCGLEITTWKTYGFFGSCVFMNSDVLVFNRLFRFLPGIRRIARLGIRLDDWTTRLPGLGRSGLQVVGVAQKTNADSA